MKTITSRLNKFATLFRNSMNAEAASMSDALATVALNLLVAPVCFIAIVALGWE